MTSPNRRHIPAPGGHLARAAWWAEKAEALAQHPATAAKGTAAAAIATAHAGIASAGLLHAINNILARIHPATSSPTRTVEEGQDPT